jgi:type VI secretion system protein ImpF
LSTKSKRAISQSIIDRLIDLEPKVRSEPALSYEKSKKQLEAAVQRDLEWLFNTRQIPYELPEDSEVLLRESLFYYGLPDFTGLSIHSHQDQLALTRAMESAISNFEPRLANVKVSLRPAEAGARIRFLIEALLLMDPAPERVTFDTVHDLTSGEYKVGGEGNAR